MGCAQSSDSGKNQVTPGGVSAKEKSPKHGAANGRAQQLNETNNNTATSKGAKAVAFEVEIENAKTYDSLLNKNPPAKLKRLAPLDDAPKLTAEQLEEKIRQAEQNRQRELEKKKEVGRRSLRLRAEIHQAREAKRAADQQKEIDNKLQAAEAARRQKAIEQEEKKRAREERARQVREKAKREKAKLEGGEELDYKIEKDDAFNAGDDESWLDGDNNTSDYHTDNDRFNSGKGDRIYSGGRESPAKIGRNPGKGSDRVMTSSTTDSFDRAFERDKAHYDPNQEDNFFDT